MSAIASAVGSDGDVVGWVVTAFFALGLGLLFAALFGRRAATYPRGLGLGLVYGALLWLLGALTIAAFNLGAGAQLASLWSGVSLANLLGLALLGLIVGAVYVWGFRQERTHHYLELRHKHG